MASKLLRIWVGPESAELETDHVEISREDFSILISDYEGSESVEIMIPRKYFTEIRGVMNQIDKIFA